MDYLLVAIGGALGSMARYWVGTALNTTGFPWGTLAVNVLGSAAIGVLGGLNLGTPGRLLLITGMLGGFTTFSAFSLETGLLYERAPWLAGVYVGSSIILGLGAFFIAWSAIRG